MGQASVQPAVMGAVVTGLEAARAGSTGSSRQMALCSRENSASPEKGRLRWTLWMLNQPCPRTPKTRL